MIRIGAERLTPKQAAKLMIRDALDNGLDSYSDTHVGQDLDDFITDRERRLIDDQIFKIVARIVRLLEDKKSANSIEGRGEKA